MPKTVPLANARALLDGDGVATYIVKSEELAYQGVRLKVKRNEVIRLGSDLCLVPASGYEHDLGPGWLLCSYQAK